jgi:hypothetical protein
MSEKNFRIVLGTWLVVALLLNAPYLMYALVGLLLFEGITNLRAPKMVVSLRSGADAAAAIDAASANPNARISFEAERGLRLIVATLIIIPMTGFGSFLWLCPDRRGAQRYLPHGAGVALARPDVDATR